MAKLESLKLIEQNLKFDSRIAPSQSIPNSEVSKFFCTFPYPYMNGSLHLGHAFTMMGCELTTRFEKARGKNTLFPYIIEFVEPNEQSQFKAGPGYPVVLLRNKENIDLAETTSKETSEILL